MKVGTIRTDPVSPAVPQNRDAGANFQVPETLQGPAQAGRSAASSPVQTFFYLQDQGQDAARDSTSQRRGREMLILLARLQHSLLSGGSEEEVLASLAEMVTVSPETADPQLAGVLKAIVLRARLELARRGLY